MPRKTETVQFSRAGGALEVELLCGFAQLGTYSLRLLDQEGVQVIRQARGSFIDDIEDKFPLPEPASENDRCQVRCRARVWQVAPHERYSVTMTLKQGGNAVGKVELAGPFQSTTEIVELTLRLTAN